MFNLQSDGSQSEYLVKNPVNSLFSHVEERNKDILFYILDPAGYSVRGLPETCFYSIQNPLLINVWIQT